MTKTILHIIDSLETGGAEVLLSGVVTSMPEFRHVIVTLFPANDFKHVLKDVPIYHINYINKLSTFSAIRKIRGIIKKENIAIVHSSLLTATLIARMACPKRIPFFFSVHNILSESAFKKFKMSYYLEKWSYSSIQRAIFVSENARNDYHQWIGITGKEFMLPNYVHDEFYSSDHSKTEFNADEPLRFISVGILKDQKNFKFIIESLASFGKDFTLDIFGTGPQEEELRETIHQTRLEKAVFLKGHHTSIYNILKDYDLFIMPSKFEGYGISMMEAMAVGLPTLVSAIDTLKDVSNGSSVYFDPYSSEDFLEKLHSMINVESMTQKSLEGKKRANEIGRKESYLSKLKEIYTT